MPDKTNPDLSAWAREQLRLGDSFTSDEARQRYMQRLADEDFVPPPHVPYALAVVEGTAGPPGANEEAMWSEIGDRQRQRVEEFARCFFQIPSDERRQQWLKLRVACEGAPALAKRLDRLGPGLALEPGGLAIADPIVRELVQEACKIFVLRPFDAAQARAAFVRQKTVDSQGGLLQWDTAARNLMMSHPEYEVLAPELIQQIIHWQSRSQELSRRRMSASATDPGSRVAKAHAAPVVATPFSDKKTSNKLPFWLVGPLLVAATLALRAIPGSNSYSPPPDRFKPDEFHDPIIEKMLPQHRTTEKEVNEAIQKMLSDAKEMDKGLDSIDKNKKAPDPAHKPNPAVPSGNPPP